MGTGWLCVSWFPCGHVACRELQLAAPAQHHEKVSYPKLRERTKLKIQRTVSIEYILLSHHG